MNNAEISNEVTIVKSNQVIELADDAVISYTSDSSKPMELQDSSNFTLVNRDDLRISEGYTPAWMDAVLNSFSDSITSSSATLASDINYAMRQLDEGITQSIVQVRNENEARDINIQGQLSLFDNNLAGVIDIVDTKVTAEQASATALEIVNASFNGSNGLAESWVLNRTKTISDNVSTLSDDITQLGSQFSLLNGSKAEANIVDDFFTEAGIDPDGRLRSRAGYIQTAIASIDGLDVELESTGSVLAGKPPVWDGASAKTLGMLNSAGTQQWFPGLGWIDYDSTALGNLSANLQSLSESVGSSLSELQAQQDGEISTYFYALGDGVVPTLDIEPYITWDKIDTDRDDGEMFEKLRHIGDLLYNTDDGKAYRFAYEEIDANPGKDFGWLLVTDNAIALALSNAAKAQDRADSKRTVFYKDVPPEGTADNPLEVNDMWIPSTDVVGPPAYTEGLVYLYTGGSPLWKDATKMSKIINGSEPINIESATVGDKGFTQYVGDEIDHKTVLYSGTISERDALTTMEDGDLFIAQETETSTKGIEIDVTNTYKYNGTTWDKQPANDQLKALVDKTDGKRTVFSNVSDDVPSTTDKGDLWIPVSGSADDVYIPKELYQWDGSSWIVATKYTSDIDLINAELTQNEIDKANLDGKITAEETARINAVAAEEQARIDAIKDRITVEVELDGKISIAEQNRIDAINSIDTAYKEYVRIVNVALSDGVLTADEEATISDALEAVNLAKTRLEDIEDGVTNIINGTTVINIESATVGDTNLTTYVAEEIDKEVVVYSGDNHTAQKGMKTNDIYIEKTTETSTNSGIVIDVINTYKYDGSNWKAVHNNNNLTALADLTDGKRTIHSNKSNNVPNSTDTTNNKLGDVWIPTSGYDDDTYKPKELYQWDGSAWVSATKYTDDTAADRIAVTRFGSTDPYLKAGIPAAINRDIWVSDSEFYKEFVKDSDGNNTSKALNPQPRNYPKVRVRVNGKWEVISTIEEVQKLDIQWAGGASKLLKGPDGSITGWSFGGGSKVTNEFKINADKFVLAASNTDANWNDSFTVIAGKPNRLQFNGVVNFTNSSMDDYKNSNLTSSIENASKTANWGNVSGSGRPADNADQTDYNDNRVSNNSIGVLHNLCENDDWGFGLDTVSKYSRNKDLVDANSLSIRAVSMTDRWAPSDRGILQIYQNGRIDTTYSLGIYLHAMGKGSTAGFSAMPGKRYAASAFVGAHRCSARLDIVFRDKGNEWISAYHSTSHDSIHGAAEENDATMMSVAATAPANTAFVQIIIYKYDTKSGQTNSYVFVHKPMLAEVPLDSIYDNSNPVPYRPVIETPRNATTKADAAKYAAIDETSKLARDVTGVLPAYGNSDMDTIDMVKDGINSALQLYSSSDNTIGMAFPAFEVNTTPGEVYDIVFNYRTKNKKHNNGFYFRVYEYDSDMPSGKTHVSNGSSGSDSRVQEDTRKKDLSNQFENVSTKTSYQAGLTSYTPSTSAKWASIVILNWSGLGSDKLLIKGLNINKRSKSFNDQLNHNTTTIDGGKITTGTIDASLVNVTNINAGNIKTGVIYNSGGTSTNYTMKIDLDNGEIHIV